MNSTKPCKAFDVLHPKGILNDAYKWFDNPRDIVDAIARIVHVSVESAKLIENLPPLIYGEK